METPGAAPAAPGPEPERPTPAAALDPSGVPSMDEATEAEVEDQDEGAEASAGGPMVPRSRPAWLSGFAHLPRSGRGLFAFLLLLGGIGAVFAFSGVVLIQWTETADFCGRCHQMAPELAGYVAGPHSDVSCGECHVEPGIAGWVKSKINGTKQLVQVITGLYPQPIPPADHAALPSVDDTCKRCHSPDRFALSQLTMRTAFGEDEPNTRQAIALMIRPGGGDPFDVDRSVHWHILQDVEYWAEDVNDQTIDLVEVNREDGTSEQYISLHQVTVAEDVKPEVDAIKAQDRNRRMDCLDCHNRVGHPIPNPNRGTDQAMVGGQIDPALPYVKRESMRILDAGYPSLEAADQAAEQLAGFYELHYPDVYATEKAAIDKSIETIQVLYRLTATPGMKVTYSTYPDNMGHMNFPGCFRCHDGGHFLVVNGAKTNKTIPSTCDTCHTFPQVGGDVASLPLGEPPVSHAVDLWVFDHKKVAPSTDPGGTACGECHARDYCSSCHDTGAIDVTHDEMAVNHAAVIRAAPNGAASCTYCHQPVFCAQCHDEPVMPATGPWANGGTKTTSQVPGIGPTSMIDRSGSARQTSLVHPIASPPGVEFPLVATRSAVGAAAGP